MSLIADRSSFFYQIQIRGSPSLEHWYLTIQQLENYLYFLVH